MYSVIKPAIKPELDQQFSPAVLWNRAYQDSVANSAKARNVAIALLRPDQTSTVFRTEILPLGGTQDERTLRYLERIIKFLLWQRGSSTVRIAGCEPLVGKLASIYCADGARAFDAEFFGQKVYRSTLEISACAMEDIPQENETSMPLGRHLDGYRIGFDLGGSDRKCAALMNGEVVFSEEVEWNPYFENNPDYHIEGIHDSLKRAARHLPRVDAIGGSSAGVYVNNEVRVASLFRGLSGEDFENRIRRVFFDLQKRWGDVPFEVVNDGEVTALAGSMSMGENAVLGLAMGTSEAVGYVTPEGNITAMINELAFAPIDYRENAPVDEWSGDAGVGAQYLSQQAVARLVPVAGIELPADMPFPEQLIEVQKLMAAGDERAAKIYSTIGTYLGYAIAHYADFYEIRKVLLLGRVTSGEGGTIIIKQATTVLEELFPQLAKQIELVTPNEQDKRHGQAVAAASLPLIGTE
ncbi:MAG: ROK family protein [Akkermansiaceae bacterium]